MSQNTPGFPYAHISNVVGDLVSYGFNQSGATQHKVHDTTAGLLFVVYLAVIEAVNVSNLVVAFESGSTEIYRKTILGTSGSAGYERSSPFDTITGMPYFIGGATGENFNVTLASAIQTQGTFLIGEISPRGVQG